MLQLNYQGKRLLIFYITILILLLLSGKVHADTGKFVKEYKEEIDGVLHEFEPGEKVKVVRETDWGYTVIRDNNRYQIPRTAMIITTKTTQKYRITGETPILAQIGGGKIRDVRIDETAQILKFEKEFGLFQTEDGIEGYIKLENTEVIVETEVTYGVIKEDKEINGKVLISGEYVKIKDIVDNKLVIIDRDGNEYRVTPEEIDLGVKISSLVSRGSGSRRATNIEGIIETAHAELGKPYVYGAYGPRSYDCSGFTYSIYIKYGVKLPRTSLEQSKFGDKIERSKIIPGDLLFFKTTNEPVGHVGIYIGNNKMIHAASGARKVMISDINEAYYKSRYVVARRVIK